MKITGAIFDMDGTLLDSMDYWGSVASEYLREIGIAPQDGEDRLFLESGMKEWYGHCVDTYGITLSHEEVKTGVYSAMNKKYATVVNLKDGALELLERLSKAGVKMCLATATDRPTVEMIIKRLGIDKYFSRIFTAQEVGVGKREPVIYERALEYLGTPKDETYVFEDAYYALVTAHGASFKTVGVYDKNVFVPREQILPLCTYFLDEDSKYHLDIE